MSTVSHEPAASQSGFTREVNELVENLIAQKRITDFSDSAVAAMLATIERDLVEQQELNRRLGTMYTAERARQELGGISRQALSERVKRSTILRVVSSDGVHLYPAFQFRHGKVLPRFAHVLTAFFDSTDDAWAVLHWCTAPQSGFEGRTAIEILEGGYSDEIERLLDIARAESTVWAR